MTTGYRPRGRRAAEIAADIEAAIASGRVQPGSLLPPVRALAEELGVAPGTTAAAYRALAERGLVEGQRRSGTRVRPRRATGPARPTLVPPGTRDLATGNPDPGLLPDVTPALVAAARRPPRLYGGPAAHPELASWARAALVADGVKAEAVTVTSGALDAMERVFRARLRPGARVAVEDPGYPGLFDLLSALGLPAEPVAVDGSGMTPDALAAAIGAGARAAVLTPRAQNPTGAALGPDRVDELARLLAGHPDVLVIEDDHAGPVAGAPAATLGLPTGSVVIRSASKALGPDLRLAIVGGDADTVATIEASQAVGSGWVSHLLQAAVLELLTSGDVGGAAAVYGSRRRALIDALASRGVTAEGRSGLNVWIHVPEEGAVVAGMAARGWAVAPGSRFRLMSPPGVRVTVATLRPEEAPIVADALADALRGGGGTRPG